MGEGMRKLPPPPIVRFKRYAPLDLKLTNVRATTIKGKIMGLFNRKKRKTYWDHSVGKCKEIDVDYLRECLTETNRAVTDLRESLNQKYRLLLEIGGRKHIMIVPSSCNEIEGKLLNNEAARAWARANNYEYIDTYGDMGELWTEREKKTK